MILKFGITACSAVTALFPAAIFAFNLQFLGEDPMKEFTQEDWRMADAAFDAEIDHNADGEAESLDNPNSDNSGSVMPIKTFNDAKGQEVPVDGNYQPRQKNSRVNTGCHSDAARTTCGTTPGNPDFTRLPFT